ncbi:putative metal-dependent hydrolase [Aequorivita sublithincola DSM 14238]|uniref:Putative metal-dependent hydrolase n=1 Tax=Aequorivita sublithincola (strain DSM 14238 / LMG 21431 / ACAM 643 / 9-3) TaxID=746697 RepID=I3YVT6_AEQSU|nr:cyclase family protein [Aequorivita sublithincola]AFL81104.1 putative metal-dependent hydrolase [Aequorivita sublithincola DSM 14238]
MKTTIQINNQIIEVDLSKPLDISIPLQASEENPLAWYLKEPVIEPVIMGDWTAKVSEGASVNFNNIFFNPHAHGTHTECFGHISKEFHSVNEALKTFFFLAEVTSVKPEKVGEDEIISEESIRKALNGKTPEAIVIITLPNTSDKKSKHWSNTNWPFLHEKAALFLREIGVKHLLIDLPSVDKEMDEGKLLAHKAFWNYPEKPREDCTITELVYVPDSVADGNYLLNLQIASFHNDASPSKPVLYKII